MIDIIDEISRLYIFKKEEFVKAANQISKSSFSYCAAKWAKEIKTFKWPKKELRLMIL